VLDRAVQVMVSVLLNPCLRTFTTAVLWHDWKNDSYVRTVKLS
jgi:hypothetical protein